LLITQWVPLTHLRDEGQLPRAVFQGTGGNQVVVEGDRRWSGRGEAEEREHSERRCVKGAHGHRSSMRNSRVSTPGVGRGKREAGSVPRRGHASLFPLPHSLY